MLFSRQYLQNCLVVFKYSLEPGISGYYMAAKITLVQYDTAPGLVFSMKSQSTGLPVNLVGATARFHFKAAGSSVVKDSRLCVLLPGIEMDDGYGGVEISYAAPYDVPGFGGRVRMDWGPSTLDTPGNFEGEVEITFANGRNQTPVRLFLFTVRPQLG